MTDPSSSLDRASVSAVLMQRSRADRSALLDELVAMLAGLVPGVRVERTLLRRTVAALHVPLGDFVYVLTRGAGDAVEAARRHIVRGVVVRTVPLDLALFLEELGTALDVELRRTDEGRAALEQWLRSPGER